eukprot:678736-Pleurochrysis_carterae.AAC.3
MLARGYLFVRAAQGSRGGSARRRLAMGGMPSLQAAHDAMPRDCQHGCSLHGTCNLLSGECSCPISRIGPACEQLAMPDCVIDGEPLRMYSIFSNWEKQMRNRTRENDPTHEGQASLLIRLEKRCVICKPPLLQDVSNPEDLVAATQDLTSCPALQSARMLDATGRSYSVGCSRCADVRQLGVPGSPEGAR